MTKTLDHERLDVYQLAAQFLPLGLSFFPDKGNRILLEQFERAGSSVLLNIAEGAGRRSPADKKRFYGIARGSATECAAILDILKARRMGTDRLHAQARDLIVRIIQMLSRMVERAPKAGGEEVEVDASE